MTTSDKLGQSKERRKDARYKCRTSVQYAVQDSNYTAFIQDISYGGGFIESPASIKVGETITMYVQYTEDQSPITMIGEVVRVSPQGFGVRFKMGIDASLMKHITEE
jgi:Tfp pilus assembly protein PilZ